jgi:pyrimidine operon attenuation protein/uracil phosphoribosyltransferase
MPKKTKEIKSKVLLEGAEVEYLILQLTEKIIQEFNLKMLSNTVIVGIKTRGVYLAQRIINNIKKIKNVDIPLGYLDITLYRDDILKRSTHPQVGASHLPFDISDKIVILIDDVIYTGRTVRAALDELLDYGRPALIKLAVLIDRNWRELPIQPDYISKFIKTDKDQMIRLKLKEVDNQDRVVLYECI